MFCVSCGKSCRDTLAVNRRKELAGFNFNNLCQFVSEQADLVTGMGVRAYNESLVPYRPPQSCSRWSKWEEVNPQAPSSFIGSSLGAILLIKHRPIMI